MGAILAGKVNEWDHWKLKKMDNYKIISKIATVFSKTLNLPHPSSPSVA
jgi:hypothetical protein